MKFEKIIFLLIAVILCFSIVACNSEDILFGDENSEQAGTDSSSELPIETPSGAPDASDSKIPTLSALNWKLESNEAGKVQKSKKDASGVTYLLDIDYSSVEIKNDQLLAIDECTDLFGQWISVVGILDYTQQLDLFRAEMLSERLYPEFESTGFSPEEAMKKASEVGRDLLPLINARAKYVVSEIKISDSAITEAFVESERENFARCGLDVAKVEDVAKFTFSEAKAVYNDRFYIDIVRSFSSEYCFFKYDGRWYCEYGMIEDDLCIDLMLSKKGEDHGFYKLGTEVGEVTAIDGNYLYVGNKVYFAEDLEGISVGDNVQIEFYRFGAELKGCTDDKNYELSNAVSITAFDESAE